MIIDLKVLQKEQSIIFRSMQLTIAEYTDEQTREKFLFTFAEKEGDWFGSNIVSLTLKQGLHANGNELYIYYEKNIKNNSLVGNHFLFSPCDMPNKIIRLNSIKLVEKKGNYLIIVYKTDHSKIQEISIKFTEATIARRWLDLINQKRSEAKNIGKQRENLLDQLKISEIKLKTLEQQLQKERTQKDEILTNLNIVTNQRNHYENLSVNLQKQLQECQCRNKIRKEDVCEVVDKQLQRLRECCSNHQTELGIYKAKMFSHQRVKIEAERKLHEAESNFTQKDYQYREQLATLNEEVQRLNASLQMEERFSQELINKILKKNEQLRKTSQEQYSLLITRSMFIDNQQDYRSFSGPLSPLNS